MRKLENMVMTSVSQATQKVSKRIWTTTWKSWPNIRLAPLLSYLALTLLDAKSFHPELHLSSQAWRSEFEKLLCGSNCSLRDLFVLQPALDSPRFSVYCQIAILKTHLAAKPAPFWPNTEPAQPSRSPINQSWCLLLEWQEYTDRCKVEVEHLAQTFCKCSTNELQLFQLLYTLFSSPLP